MQHFGFLRKKDYTSSPRKNATPKSALGVIVTNERNDLGQVNKGSSANCIDASREDVFSRGASGIHFNQNSPKPEQFAAPPNYEFSRPSAGCEETYRMPSRSSPCWKDSDFPVFGTPVHDDGAFGAVSGKGSMLDDRRLYSSGLQNNLFAIGRRSRVSSRSNSCVQSPLRTASSSFNDCVHDDFLTASVRLRTDPTEVAQSFRETEKVGGMSGTKTLEKDSRGSLFGSNENVATLTLGTSSEEVYSQNCGNTTPRDSAHNPSRSKDEANIDPSSFLVPHKDGSTATYSSEDSKVNNVSMKKVPTVSPSPLHPASSPRLKNQRSFLRRKYRMEPTEDLCIQANSNAQTAKEGASSPSSSFQRSSRAWPGSFARTISQEKSQKQAPEELVSGTSRYHLEVLDKNVVKNRAGKQTNKDFDIFASAVAAIKNAESKFKLANPARQKEKQKFVTREEKVLEKQAESREDRCSNKEEDTIDKMGSRSKLEEATDSFRKSKIQAKEMQEPGIRSYHEVLEREEIEALEAVERERKHREKERQKEGKLQETRASAETIIQEAEEQAAAEIWEGFKRVTAQQLKRGMAEQKERPLAGSKSIADLSAGGNVLAGTIATANVVTAEKADTETLQKLVENIAFARTCIDSEETTDQIHAAPRDQQPKNQPDIKQTPCKSNLMEKPGENITPICDAEYVSVEEVADDWLSTPNLEKVKEDAPEEKAASTELTLNCVVRALNEKNQRDFEVQQEQAEKHRLAELLDGDIKRWASGKEQNLRALLSTLQYVLWPECGWQPVYLTDIISPASVKKVYRKATLFVHPDKMQQKGASRQQKYIAEKVFYLLKDAWSRFNYEEIF